MRRWSSSVFDEFLPPARNFLTTCPECPHIKTESLIPNSIAILWWCVKIITRINVGGNYSRLVLPQKNKKQAATKPVQEYPLRYGPCF